MLAEGVAVEDWFCEMVNHPARYEAKRFEVKHDRRALDTAQVYIELQCDKGRTGTFEPSGLQTTEAECWIFVVGTPPQCFIGVPVERLRELAQLGVPATQPFGACPTRGVTVSVATLIAA